jgi:hypothetical protein
MEWKKRKQSHRNRSVVRDGTDGSDGMKSIEWHIAFWEQWVIDTKTVNKSNKNERER